MIPPNAALLADTRRAELAREAEQQRLANAAAAVQRAERAAKDAQTVGTRTQHLVVAHAR